MSWGGHSFNSFFDSPTKLVEDFSANKVLHGNAGQNTFDTARGKNGYDWNDIRNHLSLYNNYRSANDAQNLDDTMAFENDQQRQAALRQAGIENNLTGIRAQYGLWDGAKDAPDAARYVADAARTGINATHDRYHQAYLDYFTPQLDQQFTGKLKSNEWTAASRGTTGGSADAVRNRPVLSAYLDAKQKIGAGANAGVQSLMDQEQQSRLRLEDKARNGLAPEYQVSDELSGLGRSLTRANQAIPGQALGDVFNTASDSANSYNQGYGAQTGSRETAGLFERASRNSSATGTYT